jgi:hypothetical protein
MGHKVNPDIFRLGVSKTWVFQLRTNKNFIKNLFLFKFLKNLFMNYTIPLFDFSKRRNQKVNDKLVLRGEDQIVSSPFVKNNLLFSHVHFGLIKTKLHIESFFIDVGFKQTRRKNENIKRSNLLDVIEYKPWNPLYYKTSLLGRFNRRKIKIKTRNKLKKALSSRIFRFVSKSSKIYRLKSIKRLSKSLYFFIRNYNPKYNKLLHQYLDTKYKIYLKRIVKRQNNRRKIFFLKLYRRKKKKKFYKSKYSFDFIRYNFIRTKLITSRHKNFKKEYKRFENLFFVKQRRTRQQKRIIQRKGIRKLRKTKRLNPVIKYKYKYRVLTNGYRKVSLRRLITIISKSYYTSFEALSFRRSIPKNPLYVYDIAVPNEKVYIFYQNYKNLLLLKYFIRSAKYLQFFSLKKKIFFSQNLICLLMNFFGLVNSNILTKKMYLLLQNMVFYTLSFSFFNFLHFKKKFFSKFVFFKGVSKTIYRSVIELTKNNKLNFNVVGQNKFRFNSSLVLNYILIKLGQYFTIHEIVNPLSFYIKSLTSISGYKILITGRLTRKERAAVMIRSGKRMPLSTIKANIDYSAGFKIMKFGLVGIKVYLLLNKSTLLNLYKFQYNYN